MIMGWYNDELCHHGIRGQKWGIRRFQNADGSLTSAGKKRYDIMQEAVATAHKIKQGSNETYESGKDLYKSRESLAAFKGRTNVDSKFADKLIKRYKNANVNDVTDKEIRVLKRVIKKYNAHPELSGQANYMRDRDALKLY